MLPAFVAGIVSFGVLASVNSVADGGISGDAEKIQLQSLISNHANTVWVNLNHSYSRRTGSEIQLSASPVIESHQFANTDVVELPLHDAIDACDRGELNILPLNRLFPGEISYLHNFVPNGVQPCSLGHSIWATVVAYKKHGFNTDSSPELIQDFFNTDAYPGKRAMKKSPQALVEWALLDNGYPSNQIYSVMALQQAWEQIESSLTKISSDIVWVETDLEALELLDSGSVVFAAVSSQNVVRKIVSQTDIGSDRYGVIWNGAIAHMSMLGIPKESAADDAMDLLRYIIDPTRNVQMSTAYGYAPVQIDQTAFIEDRFLRALPVGAQLDNLVWGNSKWWREEGAEMEVRFFDFVNRTTHADTAILVTELVGS